MLTENKKSFIAYGKEKPVEDSTDSIIVIFLMAILGIIFFNLLLKICEIVLIASAIYISVYYEKNKEKKGTVYLYWGITSLHLSLGFLINAIGIWYYLASGEIKRYTMIGIILCYSIFGFIYVFYLRILIMGKAKKNLWLFYQAWVPLH